MLDFDQFSQQANAKMTAIEQALGRRLAELQSAQQVGRQAHQENIANQAALRTEAYGETSLFRAQQEIAAALFRASLLEHDIEIAHALKGIGDSVDLHHLFDPISVPLDGYNTAEVKQSGDAILTIASTPPCQPLSTGHVGLEVPLEIDVLGQHASVTLFVPFAASRRAHIPNWQATFSLLPSRGASLCPPDVVAALFSGGTIEGKIRENALKFATTLPDIDLPTDFIDQLIGSAYFYAAAQTGTSLSFFAAGRHRARSMFPAMAALPGWASDGLKFHQSLLQIIVQSNAPAGATITYFTPDPAAQVVRFGISVYMERSKGGDLFKIVVGIRVSGNYVLEIKGNNPDQLSIRSIQQGDLKIERVRFDIESFGKSVIPGLHDIAEDLATWIAQKLVKDLGDYSTSLTEYIPDCNRVDAVVIDQGIVIHVKLN